MTNYPVICCDRVIAVLADDRPQDELTIVGDPESSQIIIASNLDIPGLPSAWPNGIPQENVKSSWAECAVSHTVGVGRSTWTIHCDKCSRQVVMTDATYQRIADELLSTQDAQMISLVYLCKRATQPGVSNTKP